MEDFESPVELHKAKRSSRRFNTRFFHEHQTASIVALFLLLPLLVVGVFATYLKVRDSSSNSNSAQITPTPTTKIPDGAVVNDDGTPTSTPLAVSTVAPGTKPTTKPTAKPTTKVSPSATPTGATSTPSSSSQSNLYFHSIVCNYVDPTASGSASIKRLDDVTFANAAAVPSTATCDVIFQNSENTETGDIKYTVFSDSDQQKNTTVGKLKKGHYPDSEYKQYQEIVSLKNSTGSHELKFELNPDKSFSETSYSDNYKAVKYKVQ